MAQVSCARCFALFESDDTSPGAAPLCPTCAPRAPARPTVPAARPSAPAAKPARRERRPPRPGGRSGRRTAGVLLLLLLLGGAAAAAFLLLGRGGEGDAPRGPTAVETQIQEWRAAGLLPAAAGPADPLRAEALVEAGRAQLAADLPEETAAALRTFREAIALSPGRSAGAVAGYAEAFVEAAGVEGADGAALRAAHELVREALEKEPERPDLHAAWARLLLAVPSAGNVGEARAAADRALRGAPASASARIALALALIPGDPGSAVRTIETDPGLAARDRRVLTVAARARWASGDASGALARADERLALDPRHPASLALRAEIEEAAGRFAEARSTLARWAAAEPGSPLPPLLLARIAYQRDGDLRTARRLLDEALSRAPGDFTAARILAHRAAVERAAGDQRAARAAVDRALERVPASAPARFQDALLAWERGSAAALRESVGVIGDRGGPVVARLLAARSAELSGTDEEAQEAFLAAAELGARDPAHLLSVAGALARLRAPGPALQVARRALARDPLEGRLVRPPTDFWEGSLALAEAARRLEAIGRDESRGSGVALAAAATAEILLGRPGEAERLARAARAVVPQEPAPSALLAQAALDRRQPRAAVPLARQAVELRAGNPAALEVYARVQEAFGRNQDAEETHRAALEAAPDLVTARIGLARHLLRRGDTDRARELLGALLAEDPGLCEAQGLLLSPGGGRGKPGSP